MTDEEYAKDLDFEPEETTKDPINPDYYKGDEVMQIIERYNLGFCLGNTVKYVLRSSNKNSLQDLKKALWYLERQISNLEKGGVSHE